MTGIDARTFKKQASITRTRHWTNPEIVLGATLKIKSN